MNSTFTTNTTTYLLNEDRIVHFRQEASESQVDESGGRAQQERPSPGQRQHRVRAEDCEEDCWNIRHGTDLGREPDDWDGVCEQEYVDVEPDGRGKQGWEAEEDSFGKGKAGDGQAEDDCYHDEHVRPEYLLRLE